MASNNSKPQFSETLTTKQFKELFRNYEGTEIAPVLFMGRSPLHFSLRQQLAWLILTTLISSLSYAAPEPVRLGPSVSSLYGELETKKRALAALETRRQQLALRLQAENQRILTLKTQTRSSEQQSELEKLLAAAHTRAAELDSAAREQVNGAVEIDSLRKRLIAACDRTLLSAPAETERFTIVQLRGQMVQELTAAEKPNAKLALCASRPQDCPIGQISTDELDGPSELNRKADLLADSADKLKREARRLAERIRDVEETEHLRKRMTAIDEDLFSENLTSRTITRATTTTTTTPPAQGLTVGDSRGHEAPPTTSSATTQIGTVPLQKRARSDDADLEPGELSRYWKRLQTEFSDMARRSEERSRTLRKRAEALAGQK